jgi:hypothetical protein
MLVVIVTVCPLAIITLSPTAGTVPPGQGALFVVELQLPLPKVVMVAAFVAKIVTNTNTIPNTIFLKPRIFTAHFKESFGELIFPEVAMLLNVLILKYFESDDCRSVREVFDNCN